MDITNCEDSADRGHDDFNNREDLYRTRRDDFRKNQIAMNELVHWKACDNNMEYKYLNGFVPSDLVGKNPSGTKPFAKADTWFSEYDLHNAKSMILSESARSLVVGNLVSYDMRQYPEWFNSSYKPGVNTPEGQAFGHCFVIPRKRVFNVVDPDAVTNDADLLKEMREHFKKYWNEDGKEKIISRIELAVEGQNEKLASKKETSEEYRHLQTIVWNDFQTLSEEFRALGADDFVFGFHAYPDNSIGHLHMHVFPIKESLRKFSTRRHDKKTISLECVLKVEKENPWAPEMRQQAAPNDQHTSLPTSTT